MHTRFRTLLLAGAASLAVSAAAAQVTVNGIPGTISAVMKIVWNGQDISSANPLPVNVVSGGSSSTGSVTAAGTNGTQAQAVQGINGGVPLPIQGGNASAVKTDGSATTQPISAASLPLPTGAATAANQATELGYLGAIQQRTISYLEQAAAAFGSGQTVNGTTRDAGANPTFSKFNAVAACSGTCTLSLQASNDNFATNITVVAQAITAGSAAILTVPLTHRYYRYVLANTAGATNTVSVNTSYTAN